MNSKTIKNKRSKNEFCEIPSGSDVCKVSKASTEIMLDRFCHGKEIDFPFSK